MVQFLAPYIEHECHSAQRHRQTDRRHAYANSRSYCVAVQSAKNPDFYLLISAGDCNCSAEHFAIARLLSHPNTFHEHSSRIKIKILQINLIITTQQLLRSLH